MAPTTVLTLYAPFPLVEMPSKHPVLLFYYKYSVGFADLAGTNPLTFYASDATLTLPDGAVVRGASKAWAFYRQVYGSLKVTSVKFLSLHIDEEKEGEGDEVVYTLHFEYIRVLHGQNGEVVGEVPQVFVYSIGKAEDRAGTDGLQIKAVKCYYEFAALKKAAAKVGAKVEDWKAEDIEA